MKNRNSIPAVFISGAFAGIILFILIYGLKIVNPCYDAWIFGLIDSLSYPVSMSVVWTDSVPMFAVIFKLFRAVLPETFQYLGIFGLLSFLLMGALSAVLIYRITGSFITSVISSPFFVISFPMIHRMFYHTSLTAQWLIILAFIIWFSDVCSLSMPKRILIYSGYGILAISIHPYLWAMGTAIIIFSLIEELISDKKIHKFIIFCLSIFLPSFSVLYLLGGFYGDVSASYGTGEFECNLNSFINSMGHSSFLPSLPVCFEQYEGFAYLGLGMIILVIISLSLFIVKKYRLDIRKRLIISLMIIFSLFAVCPNISINDHVIVTLKFPSFISQLMGIFRSCGRFIWPVMYMIMAAVIYYISGSLRKISAVIIIFVCLIIQFADISSYLTQKHQIFADNNYTYTTSFDESSALSSVISSYKHIIIVPMDGDLEMQAAYYAYEHHLSINRFYFARDIVSAENNVLDSYKDDMSKEKYSKDFLFIFNSDTVDEYKQYDLHLYSFNNWILGSVQIIPGLEEYGH